MKRARSPIIRRSGERDVNDILRLNEAAVDVTSPMDASRFASISEQASLSLVAELDGSVAGVLLGLCKRASYDNGNFMWFSERFNEFLYVDRVIVDERFQGAGVGKLFYSYLIEWSREQSIRRIAAEIDLVPPNPASLGFHEKFGFEEVGTRVLENGKNRLDETERALDRLRCSPIGDKDVNGTLMCCDSRCQILFARAF